MRSRLLNISLLGIAHGLSDCAAGYMIGSLPAGAGGNLLDLGGMVLLYNALAFGGQVPAGMVVDRLGKPKAAVLGSLALVAAALLLHGAAPLLAIVLAGVAGAFFHVGGGALALRAYGDSAVGAGLFAAPGVMGLAFGGYCAWAQLPLGWALAALVAVALLVIFLADYGWAPQPQAAAEERHGLDLHDLFMIVLLLAIALRSAVWNAFELLHGDAHGLLLLMGAAAMAGKVAGGVLAARLGWRRYAVPALLAAAPLLMWGGAEPWALLPGVFLLQSATPAAVMGMYRLMPRAPATATGMCFGLAIAAGGMPAMVGWSPPTWLLGAMLTLAALGYVAGLARSRKATGAAG